MESLVSNTSVPTQFRTPPVTVMNKAINADPLEINHFEIVPGIKCDDGMTIRFEVTVT